MWISKIFKKSMMELLNVTSLFSMVAPRSERQIQQEGLCGRPLTRPIQQRGGDKARIQETEERISETEDIGSSRHVYNFPKCQLHQRELNSFFPIPSFLPFMSSSYISFLLFLFPFLLPANAYWTFTKGQEVQKAQGTKMKPTQPVSGRPLSSK